MTEGPLERRISADPYLRFVRALFAHRDATVAGEALAALGEEALLARLAADKLDAALLDRLQGLPPLLSPRAEQAMQARRRQYLAHNVLRRAEAEELMSSLGAAGVGAVALKGLDLAWRVYPDPALRPATDIDLLVPQGGLDAAEGVLLAAGYRPLPETARLRDSAAPWTDYQYLHPGNGVMVEVHVELLHPGRFRLDAAGCLARARDGFLDPADRFVHLALHLAKHGYFGRLIWVYDLALVLADPGDLTAAPARAAEAGGAGAVWLALRLVGALFGVRAESLEAPLRPGGTRAALLERLLAAHAGRPPAAARRALQMLLFDEAAPAWRYALARTWRKTTHAREGW